MFIKNKDELFETINTVITSHNKSPTKKNIKNLEKMSKTEYSFLDQTGGAIMKETLDILKQNYENNYTIQPNLLKKNHIEEIKHHTQTGGARTVDKIINAILDQPWLSEAVKLKVYCRELQNKSLLLKKTYVTLTTTFAEEGRKLRSTPDREKMSKYVGEAMMLQSRINNIVKIIETAAEETPNKSILRTELKHIVGTAVHKYERYRTALAADAEDSVRVASTPSSDSHGSAPTPPARAASTATNIEHPRPDHRASVTSASADSGDTTSGSAAPSIIDTTKLKVYKLAKKWAPKDLTAPASNKIHGRIFSKKFFVGVSNVRAIFGSSLEFGGHANYMKHKLDGTDVGGRGWIDMSYFDKEGDNPTVWGESTLMNFPKVSWKLLFANGEPVPKSLDDIKDDLNIKVVALEDLTIDKRNDRQAAPTNIDLAWLKSPQGKAWLMEASGITWAKTYDPNTGSLQVVVPGAASK